MKTTMFFLKMLVTAAILLGGLISLASAQQASNQSGGYADDWSTHRLIFSDPGSFSDAAKHGASQRWLAVVSDPRYRMQQMKRVARSRGSIDRESSFLPQMLPSSSQDWSVNMGLGAKVGAGQYPAAYVYGTNQGFCDNTSTPDFVAFNTGLAGSGAQADIIAYDNLYSGCMGTVPLTYWQYNTGGTVATSVAVSLDGSQIAFIQTVSSQASLVILKWAKNSTLVTLTSNSNYPNCAAPCMIVLPLQNNPNVTISAPYNDFTDNAIFVGDNSGNLHKFQNIFTASTPSEVTSGWPVAINSGSVLASPVFDSTSGNVLVGASNGSLYRVAGSGGTVTASGSLGNASGKGIVDAPLVDGNAGTAYVFVGSSGGGHCTGSDCKSVVYQFSTTFASGSTGTSASLGRANASVLMYDGNFDNNYLSSNNETGFLYVCGDTAPTLYQIAINANVMSATAATGPRLAAGPIASCSPITEFFNSPTDRIFLSVTGSSVSTTPVFCPSSAGCVMSFDVTSGSGFGTGTTTKATATEAGGTSGIIVDGDATSPSGTSNVYFTPLANQLCTSSATTGGCAVQASQTGLN